MAELEAFGHQAVHARLLGLAGATDATHLLVAVRQGFVLVTNDHDFLALHAAWHEWPAEWRVVPRPVHPAILLIAQGQMGGAAPAARLVHTHVSARPILPNTLWRWTAARGWVAL